MTKSAHILIGDPDAAAAAALADALAPHGVQALAESDPEALLRHADAHRPDVVLLGRRFESPRSALELARALKRGERTAGLPVVLTGGGDAEICREALAVGIDDVLPANAEIVDIVGRLPRLVRSAVMQAESRLRAKTADEFGVTVDPAAVAEDASGPATVFAICEDGGDLSALQDTLRAAGVDAVPERTHDRAVERLEEEPADAAVVAVPSGDDGEPAAALCARVRSNHRLYNLPLLVIARELTVDARRRLYEAGASLVLEVTPGMASDEEMLILYLRMLVNRHRLRRQLRAPLMATRTPATADPELPLVYSAAFLETHLARHVRRASAREGALSIGLVDVADGAETAAEHGAEAVRLLLTQLADWIAGITRVEDTLARRGARTFAIILPDTRVAEAELVLDRISGILEQSEFHLTEEVMTPVHVWPRTAVAGREPGDDAAALLARAERALGG